MRPLAVLQAMLAGIARQTLNDHAAGAMDVRTRAVAMKAVAELVIADIDDPNPPPRRGRKPRAKPAEKGRA